ncbi:MAG: D-glycero-beta-D-manno-heptose 1-phosphate adenylyltransferase [Nitrospirales bacterium]|nr:D-glycero-beta-D-manno-heptose 1-phosphate adenylyltransferase [Nitrospira sp.]MDR4500932.1 D-glycero-beta-D-manno-heptose 1-phosphate adenylyltransferase [Nitrospirales bacterium]
MLHPKIQSVDRLVVILDSERQAGKRIVFSNGCFDLLHVGHVRYLEQARQLGDLLIVGLNSDRSVRCLEKGASRPIIPEDERAEVLAALSCVDYVTIFHEPDPLVIIKKILPDTLVKGGDWSPDQMIGREVVENLGGSVVSLPLVPHISTTAIIERILKRSVSPADEIAASSPSRPS